MPTTTRARGVSPSRSTAAPLATRIAEAPSFSALELPAVTTEPPCDDGPEAGEHLEGRLGARSLVDEHLAAVRGHADDLGLEAPGGDRGGGPLLAAQREGVGVLAGDAVDAGDLLGGLGHRVGGLVAGEQLGVREPPADRRVVGGAGLAPTALLGLRLHPWRAGHRLDAARDDEVGVAGADRLRGHRDRRHARGAEPVHGDAGDLVGQAGEQHRHACDVAVVLAGLVRGAEDDLVDRAELAGGVEPDAPHELADDERREVVGSHAREGAAVASDRGAHSADEVGLSHGSLLTALSRIERVVPSVEAGFALRSEFPTDRSEGNYGRRMAPCRHSGGRSAPRPAPRAVGEPVSDGSADQPSAGVSVGSAVGVPPSVGGPKSVQSPPAHS